MIRAMLNIFAGGILTIGILSGCAEPEPANAPQPNGNISGSFFGELYGRRCTLEIVFGSYAAGIDGRVRKDVMTLLGGSDKISSVTEKSWGREGEIAVCADLPDQADADALKSQIDAIISRYNPTVGPVTVTMGPLLQP